MSIPERFYRIAKHKFSEIRDRVDRWDEEAQEAETDLLRQAEIANRSKAAPRTEARGELKDALRNPAPANSDKLPAAQASPLRTPEEIRRSSAPTSSSAGSTANMQPDPLDYHYRLLGLEPGTEFSEVQAAYTKLAARCDPARFPVGSPDAEDAARIRKRLEDSYKVLRDALDSTARRFDLLEFDTPAS